MWSAVILPVVVPHAWHVALSRLITAALVFFHCGVLYWKRFVSLVIGVHASIRLLGLTFSSTLHGCNGLFLCGRSKCVVQ
jgi:hypothetical protein